MNWNSLDVFIGMHGYGLYIWGSYGLALLVFAVEPWSVRYRRLKALAQAQDLRED